MNSTRKNNYHSIIKLMQEERIEQENIDLKLHKLIQSTPKHHFSLKFSTNVVLALFVISTFFGSVTLYQNHQYQVALEKMKLDRQNIFDTEYIYSAMAYNE